MSNIDVTITAREVNLRETFDAASQKAKQLAKDLRDLYASAQSGGMSTAVKAQVDQTTESLLAAQKQARSASEELRQSSGSVQSFSSALGMGKEALAAFGVSLSIGGLIEFGKTVEENAVHIADMAQVLQMSSTSYQAYKQAAIDAGVGVDEMDTALQRFNVNVADAQLGQGNASKDFIEMGISANQSTDALRQQIGAWMLNASAADRARISHDLFGKTGQEMIPIFQAWAQGVENLTIQYDAQGRILSPGLDEKAKAADRAMSSAWEHLKTQATPAIVGTTQALSWLLEEFTKFATMGPIEGLKTPAAPPAPKPPPKPVAPTEQDEVKGLDALDAKLRERLDLEKELAQAKKTQADAEAAGDKAGLAKANTTVGDLQKQLDALNKSSNTSGFSNAGEAAIALAREQIAEIGENWKIGGQQRLADDEAVWQGVLAHAKLNKAQIVEVDREIAQEKAQAAKEAAQTADEEARSDADMQISLAKLALDQKKELLDQEFAAHQITAQQKYNDTVAALNAEVAAEKAAQQAILDSEFSTEAQKHAAMNEEVILDAQKNAAIAAAARQLTADLKQEDEKRQESWRGVDSEIERVDDELINDIFTKRQSLAADLYQIGAKMLEQEIANDLKALTEHEMVNLGILASDKATAQEGLLFKLFSYAADKMGLISSETAKTTAVITANAAQTTATVTAKEVQNTVSKTADQQQIMQSAGKAAAGTYSALAGIPYIGPIIAPIAAAGAFIAVEAFGSFDKGVDVVPSNMIAMVHAGERIVPRADNESLINAVRGGAAASQASGGDIHLHYGEGQTLNVGNQKTFAQQLEEHSGDMIAMLHMAQRDGRLRLGR